jgi:uncharacterized membrane protein
MKPKDKSKNIKARSNKSNSNKSDNSKQFYNKEKLLLELITVAFIIIMFGTALYVRPLLPDKVPIHWNAQGQADGFSGRNSVFMIPTIFLVIAILLFILPLMEVFRENMLKIYDYYLSFKIFFGVFFTILFVATLLPNFGYNIDVARIVISMISLMFIGLGIILPKLKRNFMFGIRTGWTLSSDNVWEKTHKLGGIMFAALGAITIILLFILKMEMVFYIFIILTILMSLFLVFYSYYIFKQELRTKK